ncbi:hypothetical protein M4D79_25525 [Mycolicibacterium novocastrense]|nr:hypothetical protein M4D79_25525 [Mycolicibacterium novocastrense]
MTPYPGVLGAVDRRARILRITTRLSREEIVSTPKTAGQRLRDSFDRALDRASKQLDMRLMWEEHELAALLAAASAADRRDELQRVYRDELAGDRRPTMLVKLSAEMRLLDKAIGDHLGHVRIGPGVAKSERHQRAVNARWQRHREMNA